MGFNIAEIHGVPGLVTGIPSSVTDDVEESKRLDTVQSLPPAFVARVIPRGSLVESIKRCCPVCDRLWREEEKGGGDVGERERGGCWVAGPVDSSPPNPSLMRPPLLPTYLALSLSLSLSLSLDLLIS